MATASSTTASPDALPLWLTVSAARKQYSIGNTKLYRFIKDGRVVAKKLGARTLVSRLSMDALLEMSPALGGGSDFA